MTIAKWQYQHKNFREMVKEFYAQFSVLPAPLLKQKKLQIRQLRGICLNLHQEGSQSDKN